MSNVEKGIQDAKDKFPEVTPTPPDLQGQSSVHNLKSRLEWGEPALTIIDVRAREAYNDAHIMGAIPLTMDSLVDQAKSTLEPNRDIYIYGETDEETAQAASHLRQAGFQRVAELQGGLPAWKAIAGSTEGISESQSPVGAEGYNVASQVKNHTETQSK